MLAYLWIALAALLGLFMGSWLGTLSFRAADQMPLGGRSVCRTCQEPVAAGDLIPILSYVRLKGRCRSCSGVIAWQYPVIELGMAIVWAIFASRFFFGLPGWLAVNPGLSGALLVRDLVAVTALIILFAYDARQYVVPDKISLPAIALVATMNIALGASTIDWLLGGLVCAAVFGLQYLLSQGQAVGAGDIRVGFLIGITMGLGGGLMAIIGAYVLAFFIALPLLAFKKIKLSGKVPFVAFLSTSAIVLMMIGPVAQTWYLWLFA